MNRCAAGFIWTLSTGASPTFARGGFSGNRNYGVVVPVAGTLTIAAPSGVTFGFSTSGSPALEMQLIGGSNGGGTVSWLRADGTAIGSQTFTTSNTAIRATITVSSEVRSIASFTVTVPSNRNSVRVEQINVSRCLI
jgi:hypothetical protein